MNTLKRPRPVDGDLADHALFSALVDAPIACLEWVLRGQGCTGWLRGDGDIGYNTTAAVQRLSSRPCALELRVTRLKAITDRGAPVEVDEPVDLSLSVPRGCTGGVVHLTVHWDSPPEPPSGDSVPSVERSPYWASPRLGLTLNPGGAEHVVIGELALFGQQLDLDPGFLPPAATVGSSEAVARRVRDLLELVDPVVAPARELLASGIGAPGEAEAARALIALWRAGRSILGDPALAPRRFLRMLADLLIEFDRDLRELAHAEAGGDATAFRACLCDPVPDARGFACVEEAAADVAQRWLRLLRGAVGDDLRWSTLSVEREGAWIAARIELARPLGELLPQGTPTVEIVLPTADTRGLYRPAIDVLIDTQGRGPIDAPRCVEREREEQRIRLSHELRAEDNDARRLIVWVRAGEFASLEHVREISIRGGRTTWES